jgi:ABC-type dipeptide/oligopeptide/nickel transport system permease subunit
MKKSYFSSLWFIVHVLCVAAPLIIVSGLLVYLDNGKRLNLLIAFVAAGAFLWVARYVRQQALKETERT